MNGIVVIGEGEKDEAPMLHNGEQVGAGEGPEVDIAVDPLEGTRLAADGRPNALAVIALSERGSMFDPGPCVYMEKMAAGEHLADLLDLDRPLGETIQLVAERKGTDVRDVMVVVLDRPRHKEGIQAIRAAGGRVRLIPDGDVSGALLAVAPDRPADLLWGIGGTPEGVISAAALKCYGGGLIGRLWPRDDDERKAAEDAGYDVTRVLTQDDLVRGDNCFFCATGVTDGDVLEGVRYQGEKGASTESLVMRSRSGTVRRIQSRHDRTKLRALTGRYGCGDMRRLCVAFALLALAGCGNSDPVALPNDDRLRRAPEAPAPGPVVGGGGGAAGPEPLPDRVGRRLSRTCARAQKPLGGVPDPGEPGGRGRERLHGDRSVLGALQRRLRAARIDGRRREALRAVPDRAPERDRGRPADRPGGEGQGRRRRRRPRRPERPQPGHAPAARRRGARGGGLPAERADHRLSTQMPSRAFSRRAHWRLRASASAPSATGTRRCSTGTPARTTRHGSRTATPASKASGRACASSRSGESSASRSAKPTIARAGSGRSPRRAGRTARSATR